MSIQLTADVTGWDALFEKVGRAEIKSLEQGGDALVALGAKIVEAIKEHYVPVQVDQGKRANRFMASIFGKSPMVVRIRPALKRAAKRAQGGTLRNSVGSSLWHIVDGGVEVEIFAGRDGSGAEDYAAVQHERVDFKHVVGQAKYIEVPVMLMAPPEMAPWIVKEISRGMEDAWG